VAALARAIALDSISLNPSLADGLDKPCPGCDPDNPRAVERKICQRCRGDGVVPLAASEIAAELAASGRKGLREVGPGDTKKRRKKTEEDTGEIDLSDGTEDPDLYLEY